jgi:parallel beta-helix repeat protein
MFIILPFILFAFLVPHLWGRVIYVDQSGGGDATTIQSGLDMAVDGDTVRVMAGVYREADTNFSGKAVLLESVSGAMNTIVLADGVYPDGFQFVSGENSSSILRGFTITGHTGVTCDHSSSPIIENNVIKNCGSAGGIYCYRGSNPVIRNNLILNNSQEGINIVQGSPTIEGNLIYGNGSWAIDSGVASIIKDNIVIWNDRGIEAVQAPEVSGNLIAYNGPEGLRHGMEVKNNIILYTGFGIERGGGYYQVKSNNIIVGCSVGINVYYGKGDSLFNNVIIGCGKGISVISESGPPVARNNILMNNEWGVYCYPAQDIDLSYNAVWGNTSGDYYNCTPGEGSVSLDPEFVDPANHHYALSSTSPLIDLGDPTILDPDSTRSDIGAYGGPDALPFALTLLPRDTILTRGEDSLLYDLILSNTTGLTQEVQAWTKVILSSREPYPGNPMVGPVSLQLDPYETLALPNPISHPVPQNAPTGIYEYKVLLGEPPGDIMTDSRFYFMIQP